MQVLYKEKYYFIGIGGIGMSALAIYFHSMGKYVAGYDRVENDMTRKLKKLGITITGDPSEKSIPKEILEDKENTLIIYTPAIKQRNNPHLDLFMKTREKFVFKRAEILGEISRDKFTIAVAGTHGKTTTCSLITHILVEAGIPCYAFLGGIPTNYDSNYIGPPKGQDAGIVVVEADEFDRSFLHLAPDIAVLNSAEPDHLDIYGDTSHVEEGYRAFLNKLKDEGLVITKKGLENYAPLHAKEVITFDFEGSEAGVEAANIHVKDHKYQYNLIISGENRITVEMGVPGDHFVLNSLAATAATLPLVKDVKVVQKAIGTFAGVKRRFEFVFEKNNRLYIDDYAHHPSEINYTISTIRRMYPGKKITGIFQPHLFSRTRDFAGDFAKVLGKLDRIILLEIYPAREEPIEGIDANFLLDMIENDNKEILDFDEIPEMVKQDKNEVLITIGAGDIDQLVQPIKEILEEQHA